MPKLSAARKAKPQFLLGLVVPLLGGVALEPAQAADLPPIKVVEREIDDLKAVFATVRSKDRIEARVRTPGSVVNLKVNEGDHVEAGQVLALVADPKIALRIRALDAQIAAAESRLETSKTEYERAEQLRLRGVSPQQRVDQAKTAFEVATNEVKAARSERLVAEQQVTEGQVLAPASGRVLKVPVTEGSVVMPGESVATIAANQYVLRLELPERHARFMKKGDTVLVGQRGLATNTNDVAASGKIIQVYPELQSGRVLADAEVTGLGDYFVGERAVVWISAGKRTTITVPPTFVIKRHGLDFVRILDGQGKRFDSVVQVGQTVPTEGRPAEIEILSGLKSGDTIAPAGAAQ